MSNLREYWSMTEGVFQCLIDEERTLAFKRAIKNAVRPGDVVVDAGSGTGVLAMFAADAGAKKVYALELDDNNVKVLRGIFAANGYGDRIEVIHGDATTLALPAHIDVIICEMIATALFEELQVPVMNNMLRYVNPGYRVVLEQYHCHAELVYQQNFYYGKRFDLLRYEFPEVAGLRSARLSNRVTYRRVEFSRPVDDCRIDTRLHFTACKNGEVNGLRLSATTYFGGGGARTHVLLQLSRDPAAERVFRHGWRSGTYRPKLPPVRRIGRSALRAGAERRFDGMTMEATL